MRDRGGSGNPLTGRSYPGDVPGLPDNGSRALSHHAGHLGRGYAIEPDASAASYFFALAAITGSTVTVEVKVSRSVRSSKVAIATELPNTS